MRPEDFEKLERDVDRLVRKSKRQIRRGYASAYKNLQQEINALFEKYDTVDYSTMTRYGRLDGLEKRMRGHINELHASVRTEAYSALRSVGAVSAPRIKELIREASGKKLAALDKAIDVTRTINNEMAGLKWTERLGQNRSEVIYRIRRTVREGLKAGDSYKSMSKRLSDELGVDEFNTNRIIGTEAGRVHSQVVEDAYGATVAAGVPIRKIWWTSQDERVRTSHQAMHRVEADDDGNFTTPLDSVGPGPKLLVGPKSASDNILCRCIVVLEIGEPERG